MKVKMEKLIAECVEVGIENGINRVLEQYDSIYEQDSNEIIFEEVMNKLEDFIDFEEL